MSNPVCISPLKFYDSLAKQSHRKSYACGHISPLIVKLHTLPPFQFVLPKYSTLEEIHIINLSTGVSVLGNIKSSLLENGLQLITEDNYTVVLFPGQLQTVRIEQEGYYYLKIVARKSCDLEKVETTDIYPDNDKISVNSFQKGEAFKIEVGKQYLISMQTYNTAYLMRYCFTDKLVPDNAISKFGSTSNDKVITFLSDEPGYFFISLGGQRPKTIIYESALSSYYSEVFCFTNSVEDCLEIEYWNSTGNFNIKNGIIIFPDDFHFKLLLKTEIGKPEYNFEEESTKRLGYTFIESQVSKKIYRFNTVIPEYICDALRLVRLCDNKIIRCKDDEYEAMSFEMEAEWQTQGDLASVTCEFETDNIIANIGGFVPDKLGGDYNDDYDEDFDKE